MIDISGISAMGVINTDRCKPPEFQFEQFIWKEGKYDCETHLLDFMSDNIINVNSREKESKKC